MFRNRKTNILFILFYLFCQNGFISAQTSCAYFIIKKIDINGNEKTKQALILFESGLNENDTIFIDKFLKIIESAKSNIKRTGLFSSVEIEYVLDIENSCYIDLTIQLEENWLLFPSVILEFADRNFSVWWNEFNHDPDRLNYGISLIHNNLTGRKDVLKLKFVRGYSDKYELTWSRPYLGKNKNLELGFQASYIQNKEAPIGLNKSVLQFYSIEGKNSLFKYSLFSYLAYNFNRQTKLSFYQSWNSVEALDSVAYLFPDYLLDGKKYQTAYRLRLNYRYNSLNEPLSPTKGWFFEIENRYNLLKTTKHYYYSDLFFHCERAIKLNGKFRYFGKLQSQVSIIRDKPPFNQYKGIGVDQVDLDGFELYFIPGMDFLNINQGIYFKLFNYKRSFFKFLSKEPKIKINLATELLFKVGLAYSNDPFYSKMNTLANRSLGSISSGISINVNSILKLEAQYSVNHLGDKGVYFHTIRSF